MKRPGSDRATRCVTGFAAAVTWSSWLSHGHRRSIPGGKLSVWSDLRAAKWGRKQPATRKRRLKPVYPLVSLRRSHLMTWIFSKLGSVTVRAAMTRSVSRLTAPLDRGLRTSRRSTVSKQLIAGSLQPAWPDRAVRCAAATGPATIAEKKVSTEPFQCHSLAQCPGTRAFLLGPDGFPRLLLPCPIRASPVCRVFFEGHLLRLFQRCASSCGGGGTGWRLPVRLNATRSLSSRSLGAHR